MSLKTLILKNCSISGSFGQIVLAAPNLNSVKLEIFTISCSCQSINRVFCTEQFILNVGELDNLKRLSLHPWNHVTLTRKALLILLNFGKFRALRSLSLPHSVFDVDLFKAFRKKANEHPEELYRLVLKLNSLNKVENLERRMASLDSMISEKPRNLEFYKEF